jgi:hypothetical protein
MMIHAGYEPWFCKAPGCSYKASDRSAVLGHIRTNHLGKRRNAMISDRACERAVERHLNPDDDALRARTRITGYAGVYTSRADLAEATAEIHSHLSRQPEFQSVLGARTRADFEQAAGALPGGVIDRVHDHGRPIGGGFSNDVDQTDDATTLSKSNFSLHFVQGRVVIGHIYPYVPHRQLTTAIRACLLRNRQLATLMLRDRASPGPGFLATAFDELLEPLQVAAGAHAHCAHRVTDALDHALRLVAHLQIDPRARVGYPVKAHHPFVARPARASPGDEVIGNLFSDLGIPLFFLAGDPRPPAQVRVIQLADFKHSGHEPRELLELCPLVVGGAQGHVHLHRFGDGRHPAVGTVLSELLAQQERGRAHGGRCDVSIQHACTPTGTAPDSKK